MSDQPQNNAPKAEIFTISASEHSRYFDKIWLCLKRNRGLAFFVILPNFLLFLYLAFIASPQYISEAHFMVRSERAQGGNSLAMLLQAGGESITSENTYAVQDYMTSRDAMILLTEHNDLAKVFSSKNADFMARYPNWYSKNNKESFYRYYKKHIKAQIDAETSLSVLRVRTFSAKNSKRIAEALIVAAEALVNDINTRQRQNLIGAAQKEVAETLKQLKDLQVQIANFRDTNAIIDPEKQTAPLLGSEYALKSMLISTQMRLDQTLQTAPDSPAIGVYKHQIQVIQDELKRAGSRLTGNSESLVPKLTEYDSLNIQRQLLEKVLLSEVTSLEAAKTQANRQMVFLELVSKPNEPDYPDYPSTTIVMAISFASFYGLYIMGRLLLAGAREHKIT